MGSRPRLRSGRPCEPGARRSKIGALPRRTPSHTPAVSPCTRPRSTRLPTPHTAHVERRASRRPQAQRRQGAHSTIYPSSPSSLWHAVIVFALSSFARVVLPRRSTGWRTPPRSQSGPGGPPRLWARPCTCWAVETAWVSASGVYERLNDNLGAQRDGNHRTERFEDDDHHTTDTAQVL